MGAGNFNKWDGSGGGGRRQLSDRNRDGRWTLTTQKVALRTPPGESHPEFKFVVNGQQWLAPPKEAANVISDGKGHTNLRIDPTLSSSSRVKLIIGEPLRLETAYKVSIGGLTDKPARHAIAPGAYLDRLFSNRPGHSHGHPGCRPQDQSERPPHFRTLEFPGHAQVPAHRYWLVRLEQ